MTPFEVGRATHDLLVGALEESGAKVDRSYVSDGSVAFDFAENAEEGLLAIEWERNEPVAGSPPGDPSVMQYGFLFTVRSTWTIWLLRNTPWPSESGDPPTPEQIEESAQRVHDDALLVVNTIARAATRGTAWGQTPDVKFIGQEAVGPDGGLVGSRTQVSILP